MDEPKTAEQKADEEKAAAEAKAAEEKAAKEAEEKAKADSDAKAKAQLAKRLNPKKRHSQVIGGKGPARYLQDGKYFDVAGKSCKAP